MSDKELRPIRESSPFPLFNHCPDSAVEVGSIGGRPVGVHPLMATADVRITVGCVELHQYAGYSGGYKGVVVGCGGRETIAALHHREMVCGSDVVVGRLMGNPFREFIDEAGELIGPTIALQTFSRGGWRAGDPREILAAAEPVVRPWFDVSRRFSRAIIPVSGPKGVNIYQASRAATYLALSPNPPLIDGAAITLVTPCPEGAGTGSGERAFAELMSSQIGTLPSILTGEAPRGGGIQRAYMIARLLERYRLEIRGCESAEELRGLGFDASEEGPAPEDDDTIVIPHPFRELPQLSRRDGP